MIVNTFNGTRRAYGMYNSCVLTGSYGLRECAESAGSILDIGANVGFFTVAARMVCPWAQVISVEPDKVTYGKLLENAKHLRVQPVNAGLGDGRSIRQYQSPPSDRGCYGSRYDTGGNGPDEITSFKISELIRPFGAESLFIKIDCEGAERYLIGDSDSEEVIRNSVGVGGEFHPIPGVISRSEFEQWIRSILSGTHKITFFPDARKGMCEFRAILRKSKKFTGSPFGKRTVIFNQDVSMFRGRRTWKAGDISEEDHDFASHLVCCGYCNYKL